ncbi:O-acetylhomoserine aminocarboxypropyltransferase/cysteine synthase family protein [Salinispira pacifica]|uniref:O-acetylhomoserine sulfhydrylase/ O-succinylhomoserine sulfhydrylase n=1 Tax=Salinispira pacifica TaxID=1307761 RepID=V5WK30_9SPIO|nr:O-acetylhomoserine aminocarboxypropyltransferase/cysteine synthase family protein [Salinispira pacifica]AHC16167.1 O-acetylhomoserine sulfhydrylase/ O-succinylhomoserine sulfhydrylase [Salinispira pacifica]
MAHHFETRALHQGQEIEDTSPSRAVPIHRTAAYMFKNTEHAANLFALKELGYIYTRLMNPTTDVLEKRVADLEGGAAALATASGTSAIFYSLINIAVAGDEIVASRNLYGGSYTMFNDILPQYGITVHLVDPLDENAIRSAINDKTRALFVETIDNPTLRVSDIPRWAEIAHEAEVPLIVDNTFATPYLFRPIEHGADIVVHSLTKWIGGHGTGLGGIVVDSGKFPWSKYPKFTTMNEPDSSYHGLRYAHDLGELTPVAYALRMRLVPLRNLGAAMSPDNAWLFLQGLETLSLRMERHSENADKVARHLAEHPQVSWVTYPGLPGKVNAAGSLSSENAERLLPRGKGGMVVFGIKGGREAGERFINKLKLFSLLANVGDAKSLAIHPASTTHSQMSAQQHKEAGIGEELVRLSVGLEHIDDILEDLDQALGG